MWRKYHDADRWYDARWWDIEAVRTEVMEEWSHPFDENPHCWVRARRKSTDTVWYHTHHHIEHTAPPLDSQWKCYFVPSNKFKHIPGTYRYQVRGCRLVVFYVHVLSDAYTQGGNIRTWYKSTAVVKYHNKRRSISGTRNRLVAAWLEIGAKNWRSTINTR